MRQLNLSMEGLIAVVTVTQEGNLERAGKVLSLGRSVVGKHVGIIEKEVGAPLFDRHGGRWVLNEEDRLFALKASQSILYARMGLDLVLSHIKLQTNRLFVGYLPPPGRDDSDGITSKLPTLLSAFRTEIRTSNCLTVRREEKGVLYASSKSDRRFRTVREICQPYRHPACAARYGRI
jgi:DNA-binding transcriptional LysR family regulator